MIVSTLALWEGRVRAYTIVNPPLTLNVCPVMKFAAGELRKSTASAISSGWAGRRKGVALVTAWMIFAVCSD